MDMTSANRTVRFCGNTENYSIQTDNGGYHDAG